MLCSVKLMQRFYTTKYFATRSYPSNLSNHKYFCIRAVFSSEQYILMCGMFIVLQKQPCHFSWNSLAHKINLAQKPVFIKCDCDCLWAMALQQHYSNVKEKINFVLDFEIWYR